MYRDTREYMDMDVFQQVLGMFERDRRFQRIVSFGLQGLEYREEDNEEFAWQPPLHYHLPRPSTPEADRNTRLLEDIRKNEKAEKKKLKKLNQKRRRKLEKEKQNLLKAKEGESDAQQSTAEDGTPKDDSDSTVTKLTSAQDTESSNGESSGEDSNAEIDPFECEGLDMTSTFVTKAALIAKRKMDQKPKPEKKEKKKVPVKESKRREPEAKAAHPPSLLQADPASAACSIPTVEDNIKISTDLAIIGNRFASSGDFGMAVKYFTNAIKFNPTEFKLFGNRSFCFEKMKEYEKALTDAELCVNLCPGWVKGLFRKGRALAGLKRYKEAAQCFQEVLKLEGSYTEAAQELMRVQITELMEYGFSREQSTNALIIHGTVEEALVVLSKLNPRPGAFQSAAGPVAQVVNVTGVSPGLSANAHPAAAAHHVKPAGPAQNVSNIKGPPAPHQAAKISHENSRPAPELFPVWVGNLIHPVTESFLTNLFSKAGVVYSVKVLMNRSCAFINFTKQEHCNEAIRRFHGFELNGLKIAVRYPERIAPGMGISKSALRADFVRNEFPRQNNYGSRPPVCPPRPAPDDDKN